MSTNLEPLRFIRTSLGSGASVPLIAVDQVATFTRHNSFQGSITTKAGNLHFVDAPNYDEREEYLTRIEESLQ